MDDAEKRKRKSDDSTADDGNQSMCAMKEVKLRYGDVSREEIKEVVTAYVNALVRQGFLHMTKEGNYEVSSNQMPIRTLDEVLKRDAFLFH